MKNVKKDTNQSESKSGNISKKGTNAAGPSSRQNEKAEANEKGSYTFQRNERTDQDKLVPKEEL